MIDVILVFFGFIATVLLIHSIDSRSEMFTILDCLIWIVLGYMTLGGIDMPYTVYNASSTAITSGTYNYDVGMIGLGYLFILIGILMFIVFVTFTLETLYKKK